MPVTTRQIGPCFAAEVEGVDMTRPLSPEDVAAIHAGMDSYAVLVFHDQQHRRRAAARVHPQPRRDRARDRHEPARAGRASGCPRRSPTSPTSTRTTRSSPGTTGARLFALGNRLWHSDSSFKAIPAKYSLLHARSIPSKGGNTEFADMRAAYDALDAETQGRDRGADLRALADLLAPAARLHRLHRRGARALRAGAPVPGAHAPGDGAQVALPVLARRRHRRLAGAGGARVPARPHRARHPAAVRLRPHVAGGRPRDVGQPPDHAPRPALPRARAARHAPHHAGG